jgi:F0F1-type ATP synthase membrane subunit b/b'
MQSLLDNIVSLEKEADELVDVARAEAQKIKTAIEHELFKYVDDLKHEREQRLVAKEQEANELFQQTVAEEEHKIKKSLAAIESISKDSIHLQIERILSRFREH